jgi:hypothetical protein
MANCDFEYAIQMLRQAIDFAEIERDFVPLRKWANEVEASGHELDMMDWRLNFPANQKTFMTILQSVASGSVSPEAALLQIRRWLNSGQMPEVKAELTQQYQFA